MIQAGLYSLLQADSGVSALIAGKIFEVDGPDDLLQYQNGGCAAYSMVGGSGDPTMSTSGMFRQRVQLDAFALTYEAAATLRAALIHAVNGWQQVLANGCKVSNAVLLNPGTDFVSEQKIFRCMAEFYVLYTLPTS